MVIARPVFPQSPLLARALPGCVRIAKMCLGISCCLALGTYWEGFPSFAAPQSIELSASSMFAIASAAVESGLCMSSGALPGPDLRAIPGVPGLEGLPSPR